ncbi:MAG: hypothetical protein ABIH21_02505 [Patescibacteria group bacterium]
MSKTPNFDIKVKTILDATKPGERICKLTGEQWQMSEEEISWFERFNVPPSSVSPYTRWKLAIGQYVGYQWWWHKHPKTGKPIVSTTHPATGLKVLPDEEWYAEDFSDQGRDYDPQASFFDQFRKLQLDVPMTATRNFVETHNSIAAVSSGAVNSFFTLGGINKNDLFTINSESENSCMINWCHGIQEGYMIGDCDKTFRSKYIFDSAEINNCNFVFNSFDLENCFFASNQTHQKYLWYDKHVSKEEYEKNISKVDLSCRGSLKEWEEKFIAWLSKDVIWPEALLVNSPGCTGEYIVNCLNLKNSYACAWSARDCYFVIHCYNKTENCAFLIGAATCSNLYYSVSCNECTNTKFSSYMNQCVDCEYSMNCVNCEYCFGCAGLNRKKFHIFNKEYSETDYWQRVDELKCAMLERGEYGEFFPLKFSPSYQPYGGIPMYLHADDEELKKLGSFEFDPESLDAIGENLAHAQNPTPTSQLPECLSDGIDEWIGKPMLDEKHGRKFAFLKPEVDFYKKHKLPLPQEHFIHRLLHLNHFSNGAVFEDAKCAKCSKDIRVAKNKIIKDRTFYCLDCYYEFKTNR